MRLPDAYTWQARVVPVVLAGLPGLVLAGVLLTSLPGLYRIICLFGFAVVALAAELGRDRGKRRERMVWAKWGGPPTTQRLRFRDSANRVLTEHVHARLQIVVGDALIIPDEATERADPEAADRIYETAIGVLRARTRDADRFPLVRTDNIAYGKRRNLVGLRPYGIGVSIVTVIASLGLGVALVLLGHVASIYPIGAPIVVSIVALFMWPRANDGWVRLAADSYADRLVEATELLAAATD